MTKVYFKRFKNMDNPNEINTSVFNMLKKLVSEEKIEFPSHVPLKVHFGEEGNTTFIKPTFYEGIRKYLKEAEINSSYIETNVLYKGARTFEKEHIELAKKHGFDDLDVIIADGNEDNPYEEITVNLKHYEKCKIGTKFKDFSHLIVISHFKGHPIAGFGGAIKQLAMGCAARGGKLDQHSDTIPILDQNKCVSCGICVEKCPVDAIEIKEKALINPKICVGCAACTVICPVDAISNSWFGTNFQEKLAEYAFAAQLNKTNIYINYVFNITDDCDCVGDKMEIIAPDVGIFLSTNPVAIDHASLTELRSISDQNIFPDGDKIFTYAKEINLGTTNYELIEL